ncbi:MAG: DUF72 domain-containing protein [Syntrophobacteraceae bacterium]
MTIDASHRPGSPNAKDRSDPGSFRFRGLHPFLRLGTASDRYAGWVGQIYSAERYAGRLSSRSHKVGGKAYREQVLPVESVAEYFEHFQILEIDYTFYALLLAEDGKPTSTHRVLRSYRDHLPADARVFLKVPQTIFARNIREAGQFVPNPSYLDHRLFVESFYAPAVQLLEERLAGFIFEQEYQKQRERENAAVFAETLDRFFGRIPDDSRYHVELRTESYLGAEVFEVLERHGIGQVFSRWTWLPPLPKQLAKAKGRFFSRARDAVVRVMTPIGMRYEEAYAKAFPFDRMVEGLFQPALVDETIHLVRAGIDQGVTMNLLINNRAGGNAPLIARQLALRFLAEEADAETPVA